MSDNIMGFAPISSTTGILQGVPSNGQLGTQSSQLATLRLGASPTSALFGTNVVSLNLIGPAGVTVQVTGTWSATIIAEATLDSGATWSQVRVMNYISTPAIPSSSIGFNGVYGIYPIAGASDVRVRMSSYTSGTANILMRATDSGLNLTVTEAALVNAVTHSSTSVTNSAATLPNIPCTQGVILRADPSNTGKIYIGGTGITASNGVLLQAGDSISLPVANANNLYAIANTGTQSLLILGV